MSIETGKIFAWLEAAANIQLQVQSRLEALGNAIDTAGDKSDIKSLSSADTIIENFLTETLDPQTQTILNYYRANIWSARRHVREQCAPAAWDWHHEETEKEILYLRSAVHHSGFNDLEPMLQCAIETNLANVLSFIGRIVDAIPYWDSAIQHIPRFAMALGNRGNGLVYYAKLLYDQSHSGIMLLMAYDDLVSALADDAIFDNPNNLARKNDFAEICAHITNVCNINLARSAFAQINGTVCDSQAERNYRRWCFKQRLFLNPLNDLGFLQVSDCDVLTTPSIVVETLGLPTPIRFFNIMKQEYISARFLCYEGLHRENLHFSDRDVLLYNTLDYPAHGLAIEQVKSAFRMAYSLFDKIAEFINHYWALGVKPPEKVSFRGIWYRKNGKGKSQVLREQFHNYENSPLRGLFWLSRGLFDPTPGFSNHTDPDAQSINDIRNRLEHGFLSVHEMDWSGPFAGNTNSDRFMAQSDGNLYAISREDLAGKSIRLLQLSRAALIYLVLAIHREEQLRIEKRGKGAHIVPMNLDCYEDDWKR